MLATALEAHWMPGSQRTMPAALAFAFVAPLELVAMVFGFLERAAAAGTTMGRFALSGSGSRCTSSSCRRMPRAARWRGSRSCSRRPPCGSARSRSRAVGIALVALSLYGALALLLEEGRKHTVLPLFRKGAARAAVEGSRAQLPELLREPRGAAAAVTRARMR